MKNFTTLAICMLLFYTGYSQTICQTGGEGTTLTFTAPVGQVFLSVTFASYGTPNGSCGSFTIGGCHEPNSKSIVESILLGQNSATIGANNSVFGDPCGGTAKRLYVEAVYGTVLPLKLISFTGSAVGNSNVLQWNTENEVNADKMVVERSADGSTFLPVSSVKANNHEKNDYTYSDKLFTGTVIYYRLKMVDVDGRFVYSNVVTIKNESRPKLQVYPNPVTEVLKLAGLKAGTHIEILNAQGKIVKSIEVNNTEATVPFHEYAKGIYFIKYMDKQQVVVQKVVKE